MSHVHCLVEEVQDPKLGWKLTSKGAKRLQEATLLSICSMGSCHHGAMLPNHDVAQAEAQGMIPGVESYEQMGRHSPRKADHAAGFTSLNSAVAQGKLGLNSHILWVAC